MSVTQENIDNHFRANRTWKEIFLSKYPNYTPETYIENAWELFQKNGYYIEFKRCSQNPKSRIGLYNVVRADLYNKALINDDNTNDINRIIYEQCGINYTKKHDLIILHIELNDVRPVEYSDGMTYTISDFEFVVPDISPDKIIKIEDLNIADNL